LLSPPEKEQKNGGANVLFLSPERVISIAENRSVNKRLVEAGFEVVVEDRLGKGISGQRIRSLLASGGDWQHMVPSTVARYLSRKLGGET